MHGSIFAELRKYAKESVKDHPDPWDALRQAAGFVDHTWSQFDEHDDADMQALIDALAKMQGLDRQEVLTQFGEFIAPGLMKMFWSLIDPDWKTIDLLANTENTIHRVVRLKSPGAKPPKLKTQRISDIEVEIEYRSERKMCHLAMGIARGVGYHYGEALTIRESTCMLNGDTSCTITVKRQ